MKFKLKLKNHETPSATLKHIVLQQINDEGEILNETNVGYIENKYANWIKFEEKSD
jgi:hypothetical protein